MTIHKQPWYFNLSISMLEAHDWRRTQLHMEGAVFMASVMRWRAGYLQWFSSGDAQIVWSRTCEVWLYDIQMTFPNSSINNESKRYICLLTLQQTNSDTSLSCGPFVSTSSHQFQFQTLPSCSRRRLFRPAWSGAKVWSGHGGFPIESGISSMMRKKTRWKNVENAWKLREPNWFVETSFLYMEVWTRSRNDLFDHSFWATYTCDCPGY